MNGFLREKKDGRLAPGYAVYLLGGLSAFCAVLVLHRRFAGGGAAPIGSARLRSSHVAAITQPAAIMSRIDVKNPAPAPETRSYRLAKPASDPHPPPEAAAHSDAFDAIAAALAETPPADAKSPPDAASSRPLDEKAAGRSRALESAYPELPPAFAADPTTGGGARLLGYRDATADGSVAGSPGKIGGGLDPAARAIPRGTLIYAYLLTTVDTSNPAAILQFAAARSLIFNHRRQIPFGTRFLGKLSGQPMRDRVNLAVDVILYPDGLELPISAMAVEADESGGGIRPGVAALYIPPPGWVQMAPYVSDVVTGYLGLLESRAQPQISVGLGGLSVQTQAAASEPRAAVYQASGQAIQDFTQARLKELERRYASTYLVPAGTACWLQLDADLDLEGANAGAGRGRLQ